MGRLALNRLGAAVSTLHLCMKYLVEKEVEVIWADQRRLCPTKELNEVQIGPLAFHRTKIGTTLGKDEEDRLTCFLVKNKDVFAWCLADMPGIDPNFLCFPVHSTRCSVGCVAETEVRGEKQKVTKEETNKLLAVGFVKKVQYPMRLANMVMVRKSSVRWRMCTDYIDLNKACSKDPYLLPSIDQLVDGASGFSLLSFMDAYSRYNQIRMHPQDKSKIAFITDLRTFCYKVMPFGLKNAGATYQRLMDRIFKDVMGIDVEAYVDDMVVKLTMTREHYNALQMVFEILRIDQLKLNPEKCSFGVQAGKFLGGIEENPEKYQSSRYYESRTWLGECGMSIQLSKFDISSERRGHIKAQALADFIIKLAPVEHSRSGGREWFLSINEASNQSRSGLGVILKGPDGVLVEQSFNNQAEYEALLAKMKLAKELDAQILTAKSDLKLVNGEYQARDPQLIKYWDRAIKLATSFEKFTLLHVPHEQNERADLLSKLTST
ncbi:hypothetical protein CR513_09023, partial [Mucuna pruriens]